MSQDVGLTQMKEQYLTVGQCPQILKGIFMIFPPTKIIFIVCVIFVLISVQFIFSKSHSQSCHTIIITPILTVLIIIIIFSSSISINIRDFKIQQCDGNHNNKLFLPTHFVKCRRTLLELNSQAPYPSTVREIKFCRCLFTSSIKREIRHVYVVVVQKQAEKCTKKHGACAKLLFCS